jgi:SAM-dependent methyltransferase
LPFSERYGYDRGTPIDRYFIAQFLERHRADVRGAVAEIKDSTYTVVFGGDRVEERHVIDLDAANPAATLVADLAQPGGLPPQTFDCFILAQTIQYIPDPAAALANVYGSLRPGGSLLLTVPSLARVDPDLGGKDLWRFTPAGLSRLVASSCPGAQVDVFAYGNLVTAVAFLQGLAAEELTPDELDHADSSFVVLSCARVASPS